MNHLMLTTLALAATLTACSGSNSVITAGNGVLGISLTDAPACGYDNVNVTVTGLRFHRQAAADNNDGAWEELTLDTPQPIDLLELTDGRLQTLGELELPAGTYNQARLILAANNGNQLANSVVPTGGDGSPVSLRTPSAQQSGAKINLNGVQVEDGSRTELVVDFDACRSVVAAGNSGNYILKPKLNGMMVALAAPMEIRGSLGDVPVGTTVSAQTRDGSGNPVVLKSDAVDAGDFVLSPFDADATVADLVIRMPGKPLYIITAVPTQSADLTGLAGALAAAAAAESTTPSADIAGNVTLPDGLPADLPTETTELIASIEATQLVDGTPYQVGFADIAIMLPAEDETINSYSITVPTQETRTALYSAGGLEFVAQASVPTYTVTASADGLATDTVSDINPNELDPAGYDFQLALPQ